MIGERLYDLRKDAGLTQDQLGELLKVNKYSISSYERDKSEPPDDIKIRIAEYFHVSVDYLIGLTDDPNISYTKRKHQTLRLPLDFPDEYKDDVKQFCEFIMYKHNKSYNTKTP